MTKDQIVAFASVLITTGANVAICLMFCVNMKRCFDSLDARLDSIHKHFGSLIHRLDRL